MSLLEGDWKGRQLEGLDLDVVAGRGSEGFGHHYWTAIGRDVGCCC